MIRRTTAVSVAVLAATASLALGLPTLTTLAPFNFANGSGPYGAVMRAGNGDLYGTTLWGGAQGFGTVYRLPAGSNTIVALKHFTGGTDGGHPYHGLTPSPSGDLYGINIWSGATGRGEIYKVAAGTHAYSIVATFTTGSRPAAEMILGPDGTLYGTTVEGGAANLGTVFRFDPTSNTITTLAEFNGSTGRAPQYGKLKFDDAGNLYGMTSQGGSFSQGTLFKLPAGSSQIQTIVSFNGAEVGGIWGSAYPAGGLASVGENDFYGTTFNGGSPSSRGTLYRYSRVTNAYAPRIAFTGPNGSSPDGSLLVDAAGNLFGTTVYGGAADQGTVFRYEPATNTLTTLITFNGLNGGNPHNGLVADEQGNLYGACLNGGAGNDGTLFRIAGSGFVVPEPGLLACLVLTIPFGRRRGARCTSP